MFVVAGVMIQASEEAPSSAVTFEGGAATRESLACVDCHRSSEPTESSAELLPCPRMDKEKGPEVVLLDQLSNQYVPVVFAHRLHAEMTRMTGGCAACHHYNPSNGVLPCRACHEVKFEPANLRQPGLKGAYHRQCLNCHREWSHETECSVCHAKKTAESLPVVLPDPTDIMGILHPNVEEPQLVLHETECEEGRWVTFRHDAHVNRFGFACVRCHREETCSRCHSGEGRVAPAETVEERHRLCSSCHQTAVAEGGAEREAKPCAHCHASEVVPPFEHASTGLTLNEDHAEWSCTDCHRDARYDRLPSCGECHDADITYPERSPAEKKDAEESS